VIKTAVPGEDGRQSVRRYRVYVEHNSLLHKHYDVRGEEVHPETVWGAKGDCAVKTPKNVDATAAPDKRQWTQTQANGDARRLDAVA